MEKKSLAEKFYRRLVFHDSPSIIRRKGLDDFFRFVQPHWSSVNRTKKRPSSGVKKVARRLAPIKTVRVDEFRWSRLQKNREYRAEHNFIIFNFLQFFFIG